MNPRTRSSSLSDLDQDDAAAGPREEIHFVRLAQHRPRLRGGRDHDLAARARCDDADDFGALSDGRANRRPARVLGSTNGSRPKRRL